MVKTYSLYCVMSERMVIVLCHCMLLSGIKFSFGKSETFPSIFRRPILAFDPDYEGKSGRGQWFAREPLFIF